MDPNKTLKSPALLATAHALSERYQQKDTTGSGLAQWVGVDETTWRLRGKDFRHVRPPFAQAREKRGHSNEIRTCKCKLWNANKGAIKIRRSVILKMFTWLAQRAVPPQNGENVESLTFASVYATKTVQPQKYLPELFLLIRVFFYEAVVVNFGNMCAGLVTNRRKSRIWPSDSSSDAVIWSHPF